MNGTNYVSGSGFCFGDQQLKEGSPFILCTASGFPGEVILYNIRWIINNGGSTFTAIQLQGMYPVDTVFTQERVSQLNILNVTSLGVSSVVCRISGENIGGIQLAGPVLSTSENVFVVNGWQTAQYTTSSL